jgi:hypothetical protein
LPHNSSSTARNRRSISSARRRTENGGICREIKEKEHDAIQGIMLSHLFHKASKGYRSERDIVVEIPREVATAATAAARR